VAIHFTWKQDWQKVSALLPEIESRLNSFGARPHWGKLFTMPAHQVQTLYPEMGRFRNLANEIDPNGKFRNEFVDQFVF
jgi:xylitol oxidase